VGRAALQGRLDRGWLVAWALLLFTIIPFELLVTWLQGRLSIEAGALLKRRLLYGALRLEPEEIRHEGAGQLLGRVIESQAIEALALSGGFLALVAGLELVIAAVVLSAVTVWLPVLLAACAAITVAFGWRFFARRRLWTRSRLTMTHDLVEQMVGHRTRVVQEARESWHESEDQALERYLDASRAMDRATVWLVAAAPRGWLLVGVLGLSPLLVAGSAATTTLAVALGGILLAYRAFRRLGKGVSAVAGAAIAWTQAAPVFHAAARPRPIGSPAFALAPRSRHASDGHALVDGHELSFRYRDRGEPVLRGCSLRVHRGDRLLLEGPSGGGKSTLASLLTGLRLPESGLLLLDGVDRQTLGADLWRRRIVAVPQFHENHIFMGTFAFNLLMGGEWPPSQEDVNRAEALCRELGLGALLERMPAGLFQQVGETGWQLSHGERSRLFIARALLQDADFVVLDESFGQLDPENLQRAMQCVLDHAPTIMVIAHP
jgi:ATP-binding cassette subfamily B protein